MSSRVLVVEDEAMMRESLVALLAAWGYAAEGAAGGDAALPLLAARDYDLVISDLVMPGADGMAVLAAARRRPEPPEVVMISAYGSIGNAVEAIKAGAESYLTKPLNRDELKITVARILARRAEHRELAELRRAAAEQAAAGGLLGKSPGLVRVRETIARIADSPSTVLILGESGTGKELAARAIHAGSSRRGGRFVAIDCGSLPENLLESELFGHEQGAFTGAVRAKPGLFEVAAGGTLFLDEIGETPPALQAKLLRTLQERVVRHLGGTVDLPCDARVIAATNRDLARAVREGTFRQDLLYRIQVITLALPPLREHREDIPLLLQHLLEKCNRRIGKTISGFAPDAVRRLLAYPWPGNVRELENAVEQAVNLSRGSIIEADELPAAVAGWAAGESEPPATLDYRLAKRQVLDRFEKRFFTELLRRASGNISRAAELSGMYRKNLYQKLDQHGLRTPRDDR